MEPSAYLRGRYLAQHGELATPVLGVRIAVGGGLDVPGVGAGVDGTLLLVVNHHVTGLKTGRHTGPFYLAITILR